MMKADVKYDPEGPYWVIVVTEPGKPPVEFMASVDESDPDAAALKGEVAERLAAAYNTRAEQLGLV